MRNKYEVVPELEVALFVMRGDLLDTLNDMVADNQGVSFVLRVCAFYHEQLVHDLGQLRVGDEDAAMVGETRLWFRKIFRPDRLLYSCHTLVMQQTSVHGFSGFGLYGKVFLESPFRSEVQSWVGRSGGCSWLPYHW